MAGDDTRLIEQQGVAYVKYLAGKYGCLFRDIDQHDKGVDAELELTQRVKVQSPIIGIQVKARSEFYVTSDQEISITVTEQNLHYWRMFGRPVLLMAFSPTDEDENVYWTRVDDSSSRTIKINKQNILAHVQNE